MTPAAVPDPLAALLSSAVFLPALSALLTAVVVKWLDVRGLLRRARQEEASEIRGELRDEIRQLREEVRRLEAQVDEWKAKYWEQVNLNAALRVEVSEAERNIDRLREEVEDVRRLAGDRRRREQAGAAAAAGSPPGAEQGG